MGRICEMTGINLGSLVEMFHRLSGYFAPVMDLLKEQYRLSPAKHADETGWRNDGQSGYAWLFCTPRPACSPSKTRAPPRWLEVFSETKDSQACWSSIVTMLTIKRQFKSNTVMLNCSETWRSWKKTSQTQKKSNPWSASWPPPLPGHAFKSPTVVR